MQPDDEHADRSLIPFLDGPPTPRDTEQGFAEIVGVFSTVLEGYVEPEMPDSVIERAFHTALAEWRRTEPDRARAYAERQRLERERHAENQRYWREHPEDAPRPMLDPAWVFQGGGRDPSG